jgi:hypothetical protein
MPWNTIPRPSTAYKDRTEYLLHADDGYLLLEDGSKIVLSGRSTTARQTVLRPSTSHTFIPRP